MTLLVSYDQEVDILYLRTGQDAPDGTTLDDPALFNVAALMGTADGYDIVGLIIPAAAGSLSRWFVPGQGEPPGPVVDSPLSRYDPDTDTFTLGFTAADPELITQDNPYLVGYWQRDPEDADYFPLIGVSLLNAAKHLSPHFVRAEPPVAG